MIRPSCRHPFAQFVLIVLVIVVRLVVLIFLVVGDVHTVFLVALEVIVQIVIIKLVVVAEVLQMVDRNATESACMLLPVRQIRQRDPFRVDVDLDLATVVQNHTAHHD
uniref:Uncharacterized protein n=1 Tax=Anopheles culicifacies TaxID=139723 RepID=A0A182M6M8_9DIPT